MKKFRSILLVLSLVLVMGLFVGCGSKEAEETEAAPETTTEAAEETDAADETDAAEEPAGEGQLFRLAETHPEDYPTTQGDYEFARLVEEGTDGRIKIEVYAGGVLGDEKSVVEQVQFGAIDFARISLSPVTEFEESLNVLMLPYLYRDADHMFNVLNGEVGQELLANLEDSSNLVGLVWFDGGGRSFYNTKRDVNSPADLEGLKIRVQETEMMMDLVEALGGSPVVLAYGDVYSALQTGVIDSAENNYPSYYSSHHFEVAKHFTLDEHSRIPEIIITSSDVWDTISDADKEVIKAAALEAQAFQIEAWNAFELESEEAVIEAGSTVIRLDSNAEFQEKVQPLYDKYGAGYEDIIEAILATE